MENYDLASFNVGTMLCHECSPSEHWMLCFLYDTVLNCAAFQAVLTHGAAVLPKLLHRFWVSAFSGSI